MSILLTSLSALRVSQRALEITSHNVANVNTPGYSRQRANIVTREPTQFGFGAVGNGATIDGVERIYDGFLASEVTRASSEVGRFEAFAGMAERLGTLLNDAEVGLSSTIQSFFNASGDVANDPASISAREAMLGETRVVVERFNQMAAQITNFDFEVNSRITQDVADIDALAEDIAALNDQIAVSGGLGGGRAPNDLVDRREEVLNELAGKVAVTTSEQEDGSINVFLGSGQLLVRGAVAADLQSEQDPLDPTRVRVLMGIEGGASDITDTLSGGSLGGLVEFARDGLGTARNQLGRIATAFAMNVNEIHSNGMDYDGDLGGEFFNLADPAVIPSRENTGSGVATLAVGDVATVGASEYRLRFDGTNYSILDETNGTDVAFTGTGAAGDPLSFDGLELVMTGTPAAGDQFSLQPMRNAAASLSLAIDSGRDIAAAFPVSTSTGSGNSGTGQINVDRIVDATDPNLLTDTTIQFTDANTYSVNGAGAFAYTPGEAILVNGVEVSIDGAPQSGDQFSIQSNVGGIGDNRNMLAIGLLPSEGRLDGGRETLNDAVGTLVSQAGISGREANRSLAAQQTLLQQAESRVLEVSGVNLDEEAARLLQFQQSYQAAAQLIAVSDSLFATLLNAVAR